MRLSLLSYAPACLFLPSLSRLVVLNVSDNQLADLPCANPQLECNSLVEVYAGRNLLGNSVLEVISQ